MATDPELDSEDAAKWSPWAIAAAVLLAILFGAILVAGVRGYMSIDPQEAARLEEERKKKEEAEKKEKKEYNFDYPVVQPGEPKAPSQYVKPGHWSTDSQRMRFNYRDFVGESRTVLIDNQNNPFPVDRTPFVLRSVRPVALSKGQPKNIENIFFVPQVNQPVKLSTEVVERGLGTTIPSVTPLVRMPPFQYHFVVLAKEPARYSFVKTLDSVNVPYGGETEFEIRKDEVHYRVEQLDVRQAVPLSDNPLTWTSIAYILWDEVDPHVVTPAQAKALVDWIHWGGQLIVNGPDSLDLLKGSFLEPYLPARNAGTRTIEADDPALAELNRGWTIASKQRPGQSLRPTAPWSGITLDIDPHAHAVESTGELLAERQVGRGRIVVSAVQLSERDLINWRSGFESLFNACLLRRPARIYREGTAGPVLLWADPDLHERRLDARLTTTLNYFARDLGVKTSYEFQEVPDEFGQVDQFGQPQKVREYRPPASSSGGLGSWNDFSATANAARGALRTAAGVEVPGASFVVICLLAYLVVLVPLNWLVFHTLGRVEWAWVAAPLIAIVSTWVVVERARLDIGFVRAHTEIGILEQQTDHPRALLSRYSALYTSLSTVYDLEFTNPTTVAAPFPTTESDPMLSRMTRVPIDFTRQETVRLTGLPVSSASTNFVRSEQMFTLDGAVGLGLSKPAGAEQIENRSQLRLQSVALVFRPTAEDKDQQLRGVWIGELLPGQSVAKSKQLPGVKDSQTPFADERAAEERLQARPRLDLEPLFRLALARENIEPGEIRLVARVDELLPGQTISPEASQIRAANLVVAHLHYAQLPLPLPDKNTKQDVKAAAEAEIDLNAPPQDNNP